MVFIVVLLVTIPIIAFSNSMEPPSVVVLVESPPESLTITLIEEGLESQAIVRELAWEKYYLFYSVGRKTDRHFKFKVTYDDIEFEYITKEPLTLYNEILTLDLESQTMIPGKHPLRTFKLLSLRVGLTLIIEGILFWSFGFRRRRSWYLFLAVNLITQVGLNLWLNGALNSVSGYLIFALIIGEFFVFLIEMISLPLLINEKTKRRIILYAFVANLVSLIVGSILITSLPL